MPRRLMSFRTNTVGQFSDQVKNIVRATPSSPAHSLLCSLERYAAEREKSAPCRRFEAIFGQLFSHSEVIVQLPVRRGTLRDCVRPCLEKPLYTQKNSHGSGENSLFKLSSNNYHCYNINSSSSSCSFSSSSF